MALTTKDWDVLNEPGAFICDMHDGAQQLRQRFTVLAHITWSTEGRRAFDFTNKELRVLGPAQRTALRGITEGDGRDLLVCGYDYDLRVAGLIVLAEKDC
jgi:hypothetical protein